MWYLHSDEWDYIYMTNMINDIYMMTNIINDGISSILNKINFTLRMMIKIISSDIYMLMTTEPKQQRSNKYNYYNDNYSMVIMFY